MTDLEKILPQAKLGKTLIIGCGALSHELVGLKKNKWMESHRSAMLGCIIA